MQTLLPGWGIVSLLLLACAIVPHIRMTSYVKACAISGLLVLLLCTGAYILMGYSEYQQDHNSLGSILRNFPFTFLGFAEGFVLSAITGIPFWIYRARRKLARTPAQ